MTFLITCFYRNANSNTVEKSTVAAGTETETDHDNVDPSNIHQTSTVRGSETNLYERLRGQVGEQISMDQLDYEILTHADHHTSQTEDEQRHQDLN